MGCSRFLGLKAQALLLCPSGAYPVRTPTPQTATIHAADLMQVCVDYEREIGHPDAEKDAAHLAALRARIAEQNS